MQSISWQQVEEDIRKLAEAIWGVNALPEEVSGVVTSRIFRTIGLHNRSEFFL